MVDGHSRLGAFVRVVAPLVLPGVAAVVVLTFTLAAGEFTYTLTLVWSDSRMPVSTGLPPAAGLRRPAVWRSVQAGVVVVAIPIAAACGLFLDRFTKGAGDQYEVSAAGLACGHGDMGGVRERGTRAGGAG